MSQSISVLAIASNPQFLMGFNHLLSTVLQNKTIIVQVPKINTFLRFPEHAKNGDYIPLKKKHNGH